MERQRCIPHTLVGTIQKTCLPASFELFVLLFGINSQLALKLLKLPEVQIFNFVSFQGSSIIFSFIKSCAAWRPGPTGCLLWNRISFHFVALWGNSRRMGSHKVGIWPLTCQLKSWAFSEVSPQVSNSTGISGFAKNGSFKAPGGRRQNWQHKTMDEWNAIIHDFWKYMQWKGRK